MLSDKHRCVICRTNREYVSHLGQAHCMCRMSNKYEMYAKCPRYTNRLSHNIPKLNICHMQERTKTEWVLKVRDIRTISDTYQANNGICVVFRLGQTQNMSNVWEIQTVCNNIGQNNTEYLSHIGQSRIMCQYA